MLQRVRETDRGELTGLFTGVCIGIAAVSGATAGVLWRLADERIASANAGYTQGYIDLHDRLLTLRNVTGLLTVLALVAALLPTR